jgi:hypothetical protein
MKACDELMLDMLFAFGSVIFFKQRGPAINIIVGNALCRERTPSESRKVAYKVGGHKPMLTKKLGESIRMQLLFVKTLHNCTNTSLFIIDY